MSAATAPTRRTGSEPPSLSKRQVNVVFVTILMGLLPSALDQTPQAGEHQPALR